MLNIRDLRIDPTSLGEKMLLVEIIPSYEYKDGAKTNNIKFLTCCSSALYCSSRLVADLFIVTLSIRQYRFADFHSFGFSF